MIIKNAEKSQIEEILRVYEDAKSFMRKNGNNLQWINGYPSVETVLKDLQENNLYVIEENDQIVGVFTLIIGIDPSYLSIDGKWLNDLPYGTIHRIASNFKTKGILKEAVHYAFDKIDNVRIDTHEVNIPMQKAIEKLNFQKCGIIHLVSDGTPRIAYQKVR